jgi:hypothetical protein
MVLLLDHCRKSQTRAMQMALDGAFGQIQHPRDFLNAFVLQVE